MAAFSAGCGHNLVSGGQRPQHDREASPYSEPGNFGRVTSADVTESSGLAASKCQPHVLWTHNDSGGGPFLFAMDETGKDLGAWKVENAENVDWEDIALYRDPAGSCFVYVGDTGNGRKDPRTQLKIYRIAEPTVSEDGSATTRKNPAAAVVTDVITFSYPDGPHDSETLMVHPVTGDIYVVTKMRERAAGVYRVPSAAGPGGIQAEKIAEVTVPAIPNGFLTSGDIAPDGRRLVLCDYFAAYEFSLSPGVEKFDDVWRQKPVVVNLGDREQGEAIAYSADGNALFATSEGKGQPLIRVARMR